MFQPAFNSGVILVEAYGGSYKFQTGAGQSGGPVFFMERTWKGSKVICKVVGVHKGYDSNALSSRCTLITNNVLDKLDQWF